MRMVLCKVHFSWILSSRALPDSSPQLDCGDHKPAARCAELSADTGWMSYGTGCCLEMFCVSLKNTQKTTLITFMLHAYL